jgi:hypothetical protein
VQQLKEEIKRQKAEADGAVTPVNPRVQVVPKASVTSSATQTKSATPSVDIVGQIKPEKKGEDGGTDIVKKLQ